MNHSLTHGATSHRLAIILVVSVHVFECNVIIQVRYGENTSEYLLARVDFSNLVGKAPQWSFPAATSVGAGTPAHDVPTLKPPR